MKGLEIKRLKSNAININIDVLEMSAIKNNYKGTRFSFDQHELITCA